MSPEATEQSSVPKEPARMAICPGRRSGWLTLRAAALWWPFLVIGFGNGRHDPAPAVRTSSSSASPVTLGHSGRMDANRANQCVRGAANPPRVLDRPGVRSSSSSSSSTAHILGIANGATHLHHPELAPVWRASDDGRWLAGTLGSGQFPRPPARCTAPRARLRRRIAGRRPCGRRA